MYVTARGDYRLQVPEQEWCENTGYLEHVCARCWTDLVVFFVIICGLAICIASDEMTVSDEYIVRAAKLRADAERQEDPLFRQMFETLAKSYSRLARSHEIHACTKLSYRSSPPIAERALTRRLHELELQRSVKKQNRS